MPAQRHQDFWSEFMFCTIGRLRRRRGRASSAAIGLMALGALASPSVCAAQQSDNILKQAAKALGFATDVGPPADFVQKSRPAADPDFLPVFQPPPEPVRPALKEDELKSVRGDLDTAQKQHDALRRAYPPAAKALAEAEARKKAGNTKPPAAQ
jgi:hypothetical protein